MVKINLKLFDDLVACTILPSIGLFFTTLFLIVSLIIKQKTIVYIIIAISYLICILLLLLSILLCLIINQNRKKDLILNNRNFVIFNEMYDYDQILWSQYHVCKWYAIPIAYIYKQQVGGLFEMRLKNGKKIKFKVLYCDYRKLKNSINNIIEH